MNPSPEIAKTPSQTRRVLLLAGTTEAHAIAAHFVTLPAVEVISSLAGRVTEPRPPAGTVRIGGFGGVQGLCDFLLRERIHLVIDATHPFAAKISANAEAACREARIPLLAFLRPPWPQTPADTWLHVPDAQAAATLVNKPGERVFLTIGRQEIAPFAACTRPWFLIRTIEPPDAPLPPNATLLRDRGPFSLKDELRLLCDEKISAMVTKNSGGPATRAKLDACRVLGIPVVMIDRPAKHTGPVFSTVAALLEAATAALAEGSAP